jgi:hypothetical protein
MDKKKKIPWNLGKRKPVFDGERYWCNCVNPKLVSNSGMGFGQVFCLLCTNYWYN